MSTYNQSRSSLFVACSNVLMIQRSIQSKHQQPTTEIMLTLSTYSGSILLFNFEANKDWASNLPCPSLLSTICIVVTTFWVTGSAGYQCQQHFIPVFWVIFLSASDDSQQHGYFVLTVGCFAGSIICGFIGLNVCRSVGSIVVCVDGLIVGCYTGLIVGWIVGLNARLIVPLARALE